MKIWLLCLVSVALLLAVTPFVNKTIDPIIDEYGFRRDDVPQTPVPEDFGLNYETIKMKVEDGVFIKAWYIPAEYEQSRFSYQGEEQKLVRARFWPEEGRDICVILAPGLEVDRRFCLATAKSLYDAGLTTCLIDPRGHGKSDGIFAFGAFYENDIKVAVDTMKKITGASRFILFGYSAGATGSIVAAANNPDVVGVIADSPFANLYGLKDSPALDLDPVIKDLFPVLFAFFERRARERLGVNPHPLTNALKEIADVENFFLIHGDKDETVLPYNSCALFLEAKKGQGIKKLWILPGTEHIEARENEPEKYQEYILQFIHECLEGP